MVIRSIRIICVQDLYFQRGRSIVKAHEANNRRLDDVDDRPSHSGYLRSFGNGAFHVDLLEPAFRPFPASRSAQVPPLQSRHAVAGIENG